MDGEGENTGEIFDLVLATVGESSAVVRPGDLRSGLANDGAHEFGLRSSGNNVALQSDLESWSSLDCWNIKRGSGG